MIVEHLTMLVLASVFYLFIFFTKNCIEKMSMSS